MRIRYIVASILIGIWHNIPYLINDEPIGAIFSTLGATLVNLAHFWIIGRIIEKKAMQLFYIIGGYLTLNIIYLISIFVFNTLILYSVTQIAIYVFSVLRLYLLGSSIVIWISNRRNKTDPSIIDGTIK